MHRETIVVGLAAVMGGMTAFMLVVGVVVSPFFFLLSVPFGGATYVMWQHATGRLVFDRARTRTAGRVRSGSGNPGFDRERRAERNRKRARQSNGTTAGVGVSETTRPSKREAFRTLEIEPNASPDTIRRAYRRRVKESHPDTDTGSREEFKRVNRAYERLREE
ncbi:molecular chaperone DnaJ [Halalkaliarchaeum desulfuricum]|uniref:Molecular chaperone DnaJ n=1 Tax=Halalkaliarchaeum desulfuricum TaxID=2055893 RepID=A0A343THW3_9EURY|nr:molecular chaperone DnaJ [Halalkaliarchaeum desulfuricum]